MKSMKIPDIWKFLTYDIWRITESEVTKTTYALYNIIKTVCVCITRFAKDRLVNKASALTYSTLLAPVLQFLIRLVPYMFTWFMFTGLYVFMPNTKVKFKHAFIAGIIAGTAFQAFQYLYINSQLWVSKYNAIYGSFAALPLFLLWLHVSWTICLFGAELTYAGQNIKSFSFEQDTRNISLRYRDFIVILVMSLIAKRFERNEPPYTAAQLSEENRIPLRLTRKILYLLQEINVIHEVADDRKSEETAYQPSMDVGRLSVGLVLNRLYTKGSEDFKIDKDKEFGNEWKVLLDLREEYYSKTCKVLLKDL